MDSCYSEQLHDIVVMYSSDGARAGAEYVVHGLYHHTDEGLLQRQGRSMFFPVARSLTSVMERLRASPTTTTWRTGFPRSTRRPEMATNVRVEVLVGTEIEDWLDRVAQLRIEIFSSYPYLYEGDMDYERHYLRNYATSDGGIVVLARDGRDVVGASTGLPLLSADAAFIRPFQSTVPGQKKSSTAGVRTEAGVQRSWLGPRLL